MVKETPLAKTLKIDKENIECRDITLYKPDGTELVTYDKVIIPRRNICFPKRNINGGEKKLEDWVTKHFKSTGSTLLNFPILYHVLERAWTVNNDCITIEKRDMTLSIKNAIKHKVFLNDYNYYFALGTSFKMFDLEEAPPSKNEDEAIIHIFPQNTQKIVFPLSSFIPYAIDLPDQMTHKRKTILSWWYDYREVIESIPLESPPLKQWAPPGNIFSPEYKERGKELYNKSYRKMFHDQPSSEKKQYQQEWQQFLRALTCMRNVASTNEVLHWAFDEGRIEARCGLLDITKEKKNWNVFERDCWINCNVDPEPPKTAHLCFRSQGFGAHESGNLVSVFKYNPPQHTRWPSSVFRYNTPRWRDPITERFKASEVMVE